ncbi:MAG: DUF1501 domain-containing protein [Pirellula sp.]
MSGCVDYQRFMSRRKSLIRIGALGLGGLSLPQLLQGGAAAVQHSLAAGVARAKHVIFLHQCGGPSHIDTFDMKPDAPDTIRGEFHGIASSVPGLPVCEHLPRWAASMHHWAQVRSVRHRMKNHNPAGYYCLTGQAPPTDDIRLRDTPELYPAYGSVVSKKLGPTQAGVPAFVAFPYVVSDGSVTPGQYASFLGRSHDPFFFQSDPSSDEFGLPELSLPGDISLARLESRKELLRIIDVQTQLTETNLEARGVNEFQAQAFSILSSPGFQKAFDLGQESTALRDKYGRTTYGQSCLLARRLVESGVRFVTVYFSKGIGGNGSGGWDTHQKNFTELKDRLLPITDTTVPTLIEDLNERGLLKDTLVLWMGEFGRGPKIGDRDGKGRNHWPDCYTVMMAGGGVQGGAIYGKSDAHGAYPIENPVGPGDITATLYWALGIDPKGEIHNGQNRPMPIALGNPIQSIFG